MKDIDSLIPEITLEEARNALPFIPNHGTADYRASCIADLAIERTINAIEGVNAETLYEALEEHRTGMSEAALEMLEMPVGRQRKPEDIFHIIAVACRRLALDAISGPDASGLLPQAFTDRYNQAAQAREGGF